MKTEFTINKTTIQNCLKTVNTVLSKTRKSSATISVLAKSTTTASLVVQLDDCLLIETQPFNCVTGLIKPLTVSLLDLELVLPLFEEELVFSLTEEAVLINGVPLITMTKTLLQESVVDRVMELTNSEYKELVKALGIIAKKTKKSLLKESSMIAFFMKNGIELKTLSLEEFFVERVETVEKQSSDSFYFFNKSEAKLFTLFEKSERIKLSFQKEGIVLTDSVAKLLLIGQKGNKALYDKKQAIPRKKTVETELFDNKPEWLV